MTAWSRASLPQRLAALFPVSPQAVPGCPPSDLMAGIAQRGGRALVVVASDPACQLGTLGPAECATFLCAVETALALRLPLVLLFDSAGARLDAGLPIQGALRSLVRAMLDARLAGLPMLSLLGRYAFGAASMLASAAQRRCHAAGGLLAMSGPKVLRGAADMAATLAAIDGRARAGQCADDLLVDDSLDAYAAALDDWLALLPPPLEAAPAHPVHVGQAQEVRDIDMGDGQPVGAAAARALAARLDAECQPGSAWRIHARCPGHSLQVADEAEGLTRALVQLALAVRGATARGARLVLRIEGDISGGIYLALAAGASLVELAPGARVLTLPPSSLEQILGDSEGHAGDVEAMLALRVVDTADHFTGG